MARCKGCGHEEPENILECGFCPGCADDCLCAGCRRPWDPSERLCDDCREAERDALGEDGRCAGCGCSCDPSASLCDDCADAQREALADEFDDENDYA
jgi:hypothetical protein